MIERMHVNHQQFVEQSRSRMNAASTPKTDRRRMEHGTWSGKRDTMWRVRADETTLRSRFHSSVVEQIAEISEHMI
jgi:hypothetical protein